jgi:hypothetical protein
MPAFSLLPTGSALDISYAPLCLRPLARQRGGPGGSQRGQGKSDLPWRSVNARLTLTGRARRSIGRAGGPPHRQPCPQATITCTPPSIRENFSFQAACRHLLPAQHRRLRVKVLGGWLLSVLSTSPPCPTSTSWSQGSWQLAALGVSFFPRRPTSRRCRQSPCTPPWIKMEVSYQAEPSQSKW